mgnify:CR=1 FL=1
MKKNVWVGYGSIHEKVGAVEYLMPKELAKMLLKTRHGTEANMRPQDFLVKYVNEEVGLLRKCEKVTLY